MDRAIPAAIDAGFDHVIVGVALFTVSETVAVCAEYVLSVGVKVAFNVVAPADSTVPDAGL
jgi:hypothetical protein